MNIDAQIIGRIEPWGRFLTWQGGRYAIVYREEIPKSSPGDIVRLYNLSLRVIEQRFEAGAMSDSWIVARANDPIAELRVLVRGITIPFVKFIYRCELAVLAFRLKLREGQKLRFTSWVSDRLL